MRLMVTFRSQLPTSSRYKLAVHKAIFCPTLHHQVTDATARDVTATCNHAHLGTRSIVSLRTVNKASDELNGHIIKPWHNPARTGIGTYWAELHLSPPWRLRVGCNRSSASASTPTGTPGSQLERNEWEAEARYFRFVADIKATIKTVAYLWYGNIWQHTAMYGRNYFPSTHVPM